MKTWILACFLFIFNACRVKDRMSPVAVIAQGKMPNIASDSSGFLHLVYGTGDSIMYTSSIDGGNHFSNPELVSVQPKLSASAMRGPQIAAGSDGIVITACNHAGDIFSYTKKPAGSWEHAVRVNDVDTVAKENLMALAADGKTIYAIWLDLRNKFNRIYGAGSTDGGKTWSTNILVYASPDKTVCECCKPSLAIKDHRIYAMFRNKIQGKRDLYLVQSVDGGSSFGRAYKLGWGSWDLDACPMDGGTLALNKKGLPETVWNRKGIIYNCIPGKEEKAIGHGRNCSMESIDDQAVFVWVEKGNVVILKPDGSKENLGNGQEPLLKAVGNNQILCVWENKNQILKKLLFL